MTPDDIYQFVQADNVTLAFDTNILFRTSQFLSLCDLANEVNENRRVIGLPGRISLCVPAVAHTEHLFHMAQKLASAFDITIVHHVLDQRNIEILDFTVGEAEHCVELLVQRYETPAKWYAFKKRRCLECIGLPNNYATEGSGKKCGAPNDWLIVAQANARKALLVTEDKGPEFAHIERIVYFADVQATLQRVLAELKGSEPI